MGLKLTKVHKVMSCNQAAFLDAYIEKNTETRRQATNPVDVARAKAMVSSSSSSSNNSSSLSRITVYLAKVSRTYGSMDSITLSTMKKRLNV